MFLFYLCYAKKLSKDEAWIDWSKSAVEINQQIRAFNPYPIAQANAKSDKFDAKVLRILSASALNTSYNTTPGKVIECAKGVCNVATGDNQTVRKLYTTNEEFTISLKKPILLNGIDEIAKRSDMASRSIKIELTKQQLLKISY